MIYASKTPRDLNRDPEPWTSHHGRHDEPDPAGWDFDVEFTYEPRPEFDPPKAHNEPNPILVEFRALHQATGNDIFSDTLMFTSDLMEEFGERDPDQWDHAMRVLTKVLHFSKRQRVIS